MIRMPDLLPRTITGSILGTLFIGIYWFLPPLIFSLTLVGILGIILAVEWPYLQRAVSSSWLLSLAYPILPFVFLIWLNHYYHQHIYYLFLSVVTFDTGSYLVGSLLGTTALAPAISPGKTWEGFLGGLLITFVVMLFALHSVPFVQPVLTVAALTIAVCILALAGDLFESWLKRKAGLKHAGSLLPGHGGFLDRFDGILFAGTLFFVLRNCLDLLLPS